MNKKFLNSIGPTFCLQQKQKTMKRKNFLKNLVFLDEPLTHKRVFKSFILFMLTMFLISKSFWLESVETQLNYLLDPLYVV